MARDPWYAIVSYKRREWNKELKCKEKKINQCKVKKKSTAQGKAKMAKTIENLETRAEAVRKPWLVDIVEQRIAENNLSRTVNCEPITCGVKGILVEPKSY